MQNKKDKQIYKTIGVTLLLFGIFYANVAFDFSTVLRDLGNNSALTYEYQKQLIKEHVTESQKAKELGAQNAPENTLRVKRSYIQKISEGIIYAFSYIFGFLHETGEDIAYGQLKNDTYAANAYGAFDLMSLNVYDRMSGFFERPTNKTR